MKRTSILIIICAFLCSITTWAQQGEPVRKLKVKLKSGETVEYRTDEIEKIAFDGTAMESSLIKVEEIGKTSFKFSINANGQKYIFAAFETGYIKQYGEEYMLAMFGHVAVEDATYEWKDGDFFEFENIEVMPGHDYTILAAAPYEEGKAPEKIERVDITTIAEEQSQSSVEVTLADITANSVTVKAVPGSDISSYIVYVRDKAWVDDVLDGYGEALLQSTVERAAELNMAYIYKSASEEVWDGLNPKTDYDCIVVFEDNDGKKKMEIHSFTTLE